MIKQIEPWIDEEEFKQLKRVIDSTFVTEGVLTAEFESAIKQLTGAKHAIAIANGTLASYACLKALGIGAGDEVIVPNLTFIATSNAVIMAGAMPVFCDVLADTYCIDHTKLEELVSEKTKAIMPVHLYGQSANLIEIMEFAKTYNLYVVEDAAQGVGVKYMGKHVGTYGDCGMLSFYGNKTITCGEGGVILTNNNEIAKICYKLKNHGRAQKGIFIHEDIGFNFSFTEMQAAIGISQLQKLERIKAKKNKIYQKYLTELSGVGDLKVCHIDSNCEPVFWFTSFETRHVESLTEYLLNKEIQTRRFFYPLHLQPCYTKNESISGRNNRNFIISEEVYGKGISLPSSYLLKEEEQNKVIYEVRRFYEDRF
jgi:perosamine synthetase